MKKNLISVKNLGDHICRVSAKLYLDGATILTPGARDELARRKISVIHGACPDAGTCSLHGNCPEPAAREKGVGADDAGKAALDRLMHGVTSILATEYGVTDPEQVKALSLQALRVIKENI